MNSHFDSAEFISELHLYLIGELLAGVVKDGIASDDETKEFKEKLVKIRALYRTLRAENNEIALATGIDRQNIRIFRQVKIG